MKSQLNLQINALAFYDNTASNNPMLRAFDMVYKLAGMPVQNPDQKPYMVAPGSMQTIYDGTRTVGIDNTTAFDVTKPSLTEDIYRFSHTAGTAPVFRTDRGISIDNTTTFNLTVNGPVVTLTKTAGPFDTTNVQVGDIVLLQDNAGCSGTNQGRFTIIAKTATSISFKNLNGAAETFTVADPLEFMVYSSGGSNNQPQIGDKLILSSGFSVASWGTYEITEVTPDWIEVAISSPNGIPLETGITPTATGMIIYKSVKSFVLIAAQQTVSVRFNEASTDSVIIDPVEAGNPERPGLLLKNGSFYKIVINNAGLETANVIVATAEN